MYLKCEFSVFCSCFVLSIVGTGVEFVRGIDGSNAVGIRPPTNKGH